MFAWGWNSHGQLGLDQSKTNYSIPMRVSYLNGIVIKKIACGSTHVLAVNDVCELYVWGYNVTGALGLGDFRKYLIPTKNMMLGRYVLSA